MIRIFAILIGVSSMALPLHAKCVGQNLIEALPSVSRADLAAATEKTPYPVGNFWRATRGDDSVTLVGTYHFDDPRHASTLTGLIPMIKAASTVLVEAGPEEEEALEKHIARNPGAMLIMTGPTLAEQLPKADWQALASAMQARGIPPFMAEKLRPWYVAAMLGVPPCAMATVATSRGLDGLIIDAAVEASVPIKALEPYDTVFGIFDGMSNADQLSMIKNTLVLEDVITDFSVTLADTYFSQDTRLIWEFMRQRALSTPGYTPDQINAEFARMEDALMSQRNRAWIPVIEDAAKQGPALAAFGALHLSGQDGVLALLERKGFDLERLTFAD